MEYHVTAREVAEDITRELNDDSGEGSVRGVFVAAGETPTESELAGAGRRLEEFQRRLVAAADLEWERTRNPMFITDLERRTARQLNLEKPWVYDPKPLAECPVCAERIKHGIAVCKSCGAILDKEKAPRISRRTEQNSCNSSAFNPPYQPQHHRHAIRLAHPPASRMPSTRSKQSAQSSGKPQNNQRFPLTLRPISNIMLTRKSANPRHLRPGLYSTSRRGFSPPVDLYSLILAGTFLPFALI